MLSATPVQQSVGRMLGSRDYPSFYIHTVVTRGASWVIMLNMPYCPACDTTTDDDSRFCSSCGAEMAVVQSAGDDPYLGKLVAGKYLVETLLGEGGMGRVYKAIQQPLDKAVVLKVLSSDLQKNEPSVVARFQREARASSRLSHPNSIQVTDFGQMEEGALFIAMEYLEGRDLAQEMERVGFFPEERLIHIASQIVSALADAHEAGVIHRDMKPENVMLVPRRDDPDHVKVLDFGIAKLQEAKEGPDAVALTQVGLICGTPAYMSPEQASGHELDARSDLYAVGVMMYQLATGELPFTADSSIGIVTKHLVEDPVPVREVRPSISVELESIISACMTKKPADRPASAEELLERLRGMRPAHVQGSTTTSSSPAAPDAPSTQPTPGGGDEAFVDGAAAGSSGLTTGRGDVPRKGGMARVALLLSALVVGGAASVYFVASGTLAELLGQAPGQGEEVLTHHAPSDRDQKPAVKKEGDSDSPAEAEAKAETREEAEGVVSGALAEERTKASIAPTEDPQPVSPAKSTPVPTEDPKTASREKASTSGIGQRQDAGEEPSPVTTTAEQDATARIDVTTESDTVSPQSHSSAAPRRTVERVSPPGTRSETSDPEDVGDESGSGQVARDAARARILASSADRHLQRNEHERALGLYKQAARLNPSESVYQRQIGLAKLSLGREDAAVTHLRRYLRMAPNAQDNAEIQQLVNQHVRR